MREEGIEAAAGYDAAKAFFGIGPGQSMPINPHLEEWLCDFDAAILIETIERRVPTHGFRQPDHRFERGRMKFGLWAEGVARRNDCQASFEDVGGAHPQYGGAHRMGMFQRRC